MTNNVYMHGIPKGKIIRDAVHGDIFVEDKFLKIIDTPEFQRMRRIKQLSVANIVFPSADHTRFSHSLGCFYVMKQTSLDKGTQRKTTENELPILTQCTA